MTPSPPAGASPEWETRVAAVWASADDTDAATLRERIQGLAAELPEGSAIADFERGSVADTTGDPERAARFYRQALAAGLTGVRRRRATIQLTSTLRNLGRYTEALELLEGEQGRESDELDDAVAAFLALVLVDLGREGEATGIALTALARHLPRYTRSVTAYATALRPADIS
ncbi:tetratricopeptide repeat protein [Spiractinospora alimapuensis]|uniref:tetratricopeptide repeat protein n=1 Tax=Spiractinospora alimapuensis TaxID=2820884 RepID=UPI001F37C3B4|nr:tetratricopeptide repeat protein [Spiractinospora alimapuensis]QVQ52700.1 tetratricopeptide repeat protein [Spiractinospora alimapuensis]